VINETLRKRKKKYLLFLLALVLARVAAASLTLDAGAPTPLSSFLGALGLGLALVFLWQTWHFARELGYGAGPAAAFVIFSILPITGMVVLLLLLRRYKKVLGVGFDFFLRDLEPAA
jgi:hypothetical protein